MKKAIIVTSRKYFTTTDRFEPFAGDEFSNLLKKDYLKEIELEEDDRDFLDSMEGEEKDMMDHKLKLFSFFVRDMEHSNIADYMYSWMEEENTSFPIKKFSVDASDYVVYLAPCYPLWINSSDFNIRQNYLASVISTCMNDLEDGDQVMVVSHDKDIYPDHLCMNPAASDIVKGSGMDQLIGEGKVSISDIYCFMHSRASDMYVEFVDKLPIGITHKMCELAEKIVKFKSEN